MFFRRINGLRPARILAVLLVLGAATTLRAQDASGGGAPVIDARLLEETAREVVQRGGEVPQTPGELVPESDAEGQPKKKDDPFVDDPGQQQGAPVVEAPKSIEPCEPLVDPGDCPRPCPSCVGPCGCRSAGGLGGGGFGLGLVADCDHGEPWALADVLLGDQGVLTVGGWLQSGFHSAPTAIGQAGAFNVHPDRWNWHQAYAYLERDADGSEGFDVGFRADFVYGVDAQDTQAFGNPPGVFDFGWNRGIYGWAIPQLYGELAVGDFSLIAGHFYTLVGYEVVTAPDNFFYSHAWTMYNSEPFTHTGALGTYSLGERVEVYAGWTLGWDTGFSQLNGGSNFLGGLSVQATEDVSITYIATLGNFGSVGKGYGHSVVMDVALTDAWNYVLQSDYFENDQFRETIGLNQYSFYALNDCVRLGTRVEWWKADGQSHYNWTAGVNLLPTANFRLRPEYRYNWVPGGNLQQAVFGVDAIMVF